MREQKIPNQDLLGRSLAYVQLCARLLARARDTPENRKIFNIEWIVLFITRAHKWQTAIG